jgi:hypothetical protein
MQKIIGGFRPGAPGDYPCGQKFFVSPLTLALPPAMGRGDTRKELLAPARTACRAFGEGAPGSGALPFFSISVNAPDKEARVGVVAREAAVNCGDQEGEG